MARYFLHFAYDGKAYHGWQIQPNGSSVQETLQGALSTILRQDVTLTGAGRTDTGVNAREMTAHFDIPEPIDEGTLCHKLNSLLPRDIAIKSVERVTDDMHARFSAKSRTYHYYLHQRKDPFLRHFSLELHYNLDFQAMNQAAGMLLSYSDFAAFEKSNTDVKTTICHVTEAFWQQDAPQVWHFRITANRFLRNMVRAIVGTLLEVGRGRMTLLQFQQVIEQKSRQQAGESVSSHALFLEEIAY